VTQRAASKVADIGGAFLEVAGIQRAGDWDVIPLRRTTGWSTAAAF
jgi:hypothetical protein